MEPGPAPLPRERALVPYRQRMVHLGSYPGPVSVSPLIPGTVRVREVYHLWVSDLAMRKLRTVEA